MPRRISLDGRVAIVTGGGRGLGAAYARELAARGAAVVVHDNGASTDGTGSDPGPATSIVAEINADGGRAAACTTDASTDSGGRAAVDTAVNEFGRLDIVVANAGIITSDPLPDWTTKRFEAQLRHHLMAAFHVVRPAFSLMQSAGYGRFVFVSSAAGVFGQPGLAGYATAKTGMLGLMAVTALEGADHGITANAIMPMGDTRMTTALIGSGPENTDARAFMRTMRLDQVAPLVAYLASERCTLTHRTFSAFRGRIAALQIGVTDGWFSPSAMSAEDVEDNLDRITDTTGLLVPYSIFDEIAHATDRRT